MTTKMQNLMTVLCLGLLLTAATSCEDVLGVRGKGDVVTEIRQAKDFHALDISTNGEVELRIDSVYRVEVRCEESIIAYLETIVDDGVLNIHFDRDVYDVDNLKIIASAPSWDAIDVAGSADVDVPDEISGDLLDLSVAGSGEIKVFKAGFNKIKARITGSGDMTLAGQAEDLDCSVTGSGNLDALDCPVLSAKVTVSGSGDVRLDVSESLDVTISGSGDVEYRGNPKVTSNISGSGKVRKI